jgi:hypothetical protein
MRVSDKTQSDLLAASSQIRALLSDSCNRQHDLSRSQSLADSSARYDSLRLQQLAAAAATAADCHLHSEDIAHKLVTSRPSVSTSCPTTDAAAWMNNVIDAAIARSRILEADRKTAADALYDRLRAV